MTGSNKKKKSDLNDLVKMNYECDSIDDLISQVTSFLGEIKKLEFKETKLTDTDKPHQVIEKCKLKERLIFFNTLYKDINEPSKNARYLSAMSDLLAIYIDLEIFCSTDSLTDSKKKSSKKEEKKIKELMSIIVSSLFTMLDKSEDYMLDTVLKLKHPSKEDPSTTLCHRIYCSIYRFFVKRAAHRQTSDLTYMRYILVYKLWLDIMQEVDKEATIKEAAKRLYPPPGFRERWRTFPKILPKPMKDMKNVTEFKLKAQCNLSESIKMMLKTSRLALHCNLFPNIRSKPHLMSRVIPKEPVSKPNAPVQEISTVHSAADDLWARLHCEDPLSESSLYNQVIHYKSPRKLTVTKMLKMLNRHKVQVNNKSRKKSRKKKVSPKARRSKLGCRSKVEDQTGVNTILRINGEKENRKRLMPELPVLKEVKISPPPLKMVKFEYWDPANHVPVLYDKKKDHPVVSVAVPPFRALEQNHSEMEMAAATVSPLAKSSLPNMVDASVSTIDDFNWSPCVSKPNESCHQSLPGLPYEQPNISEQGVQCIIDNPAGLPTSQPDDPLRGIVYGSTASQKKDLAKRSLDGCAGVLDAQFEEPNWGPLDGLGLFSEESELFREFFKEDVSTTPHQNSEAHDIWVQEFS